MNYARVRAAGFQAVRRAYRWPWRPGAAGAALVLIGWAISGMGWPATGLKVAGVGAVLFLTVTAWWWARNVARPHTTKTLVRRRAEQDQRSDGVATVLDLAELVSPKALRLQAKVLRPSTRRLSWWRRRRIDAAALGVLGCKLGWGLWGQQVWSSCEDATMRVGGPRTGKTQSLACYAADAPGALITTSTRLDLAQAVHAVRVRRGAVHIFNPSGLGRVPSTLRWRVLSGCEDYATAPRRASDLIPQSAGEGERWDAQARRVLSLLLNAAALAGGTMRDVVRWAADSSPEGLQEITIALMKGGPGGRERAAALKEFWTGNDRTRSSITTTMAVPLAWMSDDRASQLGDADPDDPELVDMRELIQRGQTLHMIGHEEHGTFSPLIGALVAEIAHAARTLAEEQLGGRLDPPLTMVLDEAAIVAPVPLDRWTADMGGRGVTIHISVQSLAQLRGRWGREGAEAILANVATFIVFGGSVAPDDLGDISSLTGEHRMKVIGVDPRPDRHRTDRDGRDRSGRNAGDDYGEGELRGQFRWVPVMSKAQIRALQHGQVLILRRGLHAVVGWAPKIGDRRGHVVLPLPRTGAEATAQLEALFADSKSGRARAVVARARAGVARVRTGAADRLRARATRAQELARAGTRGKDDEAPAGRSDDGQRGGTSRDEEAA